MPTLCLCTVCFVVLAFAFPTAVSDVTSLSTLTAQLQVLHARSFIHVTSVRYIRAFFFCARFRVVWVSGGVDPLVLELSIIWGEWCGLYAGSFRRRHTPPLPSSHLIGG
jgi:hypothetical protein